MTIFNKRNAAVGYLALKALDRRRSKRSGLRLGLYIALGLVSMGILAGVAAVAMRRHAGATDAGRDEGSATTDEAESDAVESEIVGEHVTAAPEPIPAT